MYKELAEICSRPRPFEFYTAEDLWTNEHTSKKMLEFHLNDSVDVSSRNSRFIQRSVEWMCSHFEITADSAIADFGCGPGLYATELARTGARVTGVDFSQRSLAYAQQVSDRDSLGIQYRHVNYLNFESSDRFDLILMIMCDFCALSPEQRKTLLNKFAAWLKPGGAILLDVYTLKAFEDKETAFVCEFNQLDGFWSSQDYYCFVNAFKYGAEKVSLDKYTIVEPDKTRSVYNWLQYFDEQMLRREFEGAGLVIEELYGDVSGQPYDETLHEFAIVARQP